MSYGKVPSREFSLESQRGEVQPVLKDQDAKEALPIIIPDGISPLSSFRSTQSARDSNVTIDIDRRPLSRRVSINQGRSQSQSGTGSPRVTSKLPIFDLAIQKLTYKETVKRRSARGKTERTVLNGVTADARHGELLAIFGPSGCGKTRLLEAIGGRINGKNLEGSILVNGKPMDNNFKSISGYVLRGDALFPLLTVRETLLYSARLRMRNSSTFKEKQERVDLVLQQLSLSLCANIPVGNDQIRGISKGERRRVSIGVDVIHDPSVMLLEEPTYGLDNNSALQVMEHLLMMAKQHGRTVVLTVDRPGFSLLETIHNCLVLVEGNVVYHGRPVGMLNFFADLGYSMPQHMTVVEYFLKTINDCQEMPKGLHKLVEHYQQKRKSRLKKDEQIVLSHTELQQPYSTSFLTQTLVLAERNVKNTFHTKEVFLFRAAILLFGALVMGSLFFRSKQDLSGLAHRRTFIGLSLYFLLFISTQSLPLQVSERQVFTRETSRGLYHTSASVLAGSLVSTAFLAVLAVVFSCVSYLMVGFTLNPVAFLFYLLVYFVVMAMAASLVACVVEFVPRLTTANWILQGYLFLSFLFSGYFIPREAIPVYWLPVHYVSLIKYPYEALLNSELKRHPNTLWVPGKDSNQVLSDLSLGKVHEWRNVAVMVFFTVTYRLLFYLHLVWTRNYRCKKNK